MCTGYVFKKNILKSWFNILQNSVENRICRYSKYDQYLEADRRKCSILARVNPKSGVHPK